MRYSGSVWIGGRVAPAGTAVNKNSRKTSSQFPDLCWWLELMIAFKSSGDAKVFDGPSGAMERSRSLMVFKPKCSHPSSEPGARPLVGDEAKSNCVLH